MGDVNFAASRSLPCALAGAPALRRLCLATNSKIVVGAGRGGVGLSDVGPVREKQACRRAAGAVWLDVGNACVTRAPRSLPPPHPTPLHPLHPRPCAQVRKADVGLLLSLPRLARLSLGVRMAPSVSLALLTEAPGLQVVQP